jgi:hypothetical protein
VMSEQLQVETGRHVTRLPAIAAVKPSSRNRAT